MTVVWLVLIGFACFVLGWLLRDLVAVRADDDRWERGMTIDLSAPAARGELDWDFPPPFAGELYDPGRKR